jgi:DMSO/TMAO reductase YedYZ molybdopterin-dependent catalytic subunit
LPDDHGFPARVIVPGIYGMKNVKWLTELELVDHDFKGYWEKRGWSDDAEVQMMSRIDLPGHSETLQGRGYTIKGIAFSGTRGIKQVEVSTDGGTTWHPAALEPALSPFSWVRWSSRWKIPGPGHYKLVVRATDGQGILQSPIRRGEYPDGKSGLHDITVKVEA